MPFDGSGNFNRVMNWVNDALANIKIKADRHDSEDDNFAAGLSNTITKDGQSSPTANIPMNGKKLVNVGAPTVATDAATKAYADGIRSFSTAISLTGAVPEARVGFTVADIGFGARVAGTPAGTNNRFVWNDKPDLSGTDVATLNDVGTLQLVGSAVASNFMAAAATPTQAILGTNGVAGNVFLRPNGPASATGQVSVDSAGSMIVNGNLTGVGNFNASQNFISTTASIVLAATGAGQVVLRPNGAASSAGQMVVASAGHVSIAGTCTAANYEGGNFNSGAQNATFTVFANHRCKNGISVAGGGFGANAFNMLWNTAAMVLFADNTNLGTINTTSDYRIKKDVVDLPSTWGQVKALRPIKYTQAEFQPPMSDETKATVVQQAIEQYARENGIPVEEVSENDFPAKPAADPLFAADDIERWGFIAHETQETLVGTAATGEKDMLDGVQSLQWAPIVAALTKALQEAMARIEALEAQLA